MDLQHNGVAITINPDNAKFEARVNGKKITAPSFDAMKRQIDKLQVFKSFKILILPRYYGHSMGEDEVIGIGRRKGGYPRGKPAFKSKHREELSEVIEDTPANRKAIADLIAMQKEHAKIHEAHEKEQRKAEAAIPRRSAEKEAGKA